MQTLVRSTKFLLFNSPNFLHFIFACMLVTQFYCNPIRFLFVQIMEGILFLLELANHLSVIQRKPDRKHIYIVIWWLFVRFDWYLPYFLFLKSYTPQQIFWKWGFPYIFVVRHNGYSKCKKILSVCDYLIHSMKTS